MRAGITARLIATVGPIEGADTEPPVEESASMSHGYDPVVADSLLQWGFRAVGVLAFGGFVRASAEGQRYLETSRCPANDVASVTGGVVASKANRSC